MRTLQPLYISLPAFVLGGFVGLLFLMPARHPAPLPWTTSLPSEPVASPATRTAWGKLAPKRRQRIAKNYIRYSSMPPEERQFIQNRWQYYRHLPAWRQEEMLREFERMQESATVHAAPRPPEGSGG